MTLPKKLRLLTAPQGQAKMAKGMKRGVWTWILNLSPHLESGRNTCPWAGVCAKSCIKGSGQNSMSPARNARLWKTALFFDEPVDFKAMLCKEIEAAIKKAEKYKVVPAFRLNGLSDIDWSWVVEKYIGRAHFYDYTKGIARAIRLKRTHPSYHLVYSWSEKSEKELDKVNEFLEMGGNVAVVFATKKGEALPQWWRGRLVIDGDLDDVRFNDPAGCVVGLRFKSAKTIHVKREEAVNEGFAVRV